MMIKRLLVPTLMLVSMLYATTPTQENVTKLYIAMFERAPSAGGLEYWINSRMSLEGIAASFFEQRETRDKYPADFTNTDFIYQVYGYLFTRDPNTEGFKYWLKELESGRIARSVFILAIIYGAQGNDAKILENRTIAGIAFANSGKKDKDEAYTIIQAVSGDPESVKDVLCKHGLGPCTEEPDPGQGNPYIHASASIDIEKVATPAIEGDILPFIVGIELKNCNEKPKVNWIVSERPNGSTSSIYTTGDSKEKVYVFKSEIIGDKAGDYRVIVTATACGVSDSCKAYGKIEKEN
jgi:hypothetical protein